MRKINAKTLNNGFLVLLLASITLIESDAQWLQFTDSTTSRLVLTDISADDPQEKDITKGDFDKDGWLDLVVVRKTPFGVAGPQSDLLLMNKNGVLVDKTALYAPEFLSNTSDARDVFAGDLDGDGWTDLVLANTFEDQPILYLNRGSDSLGNWLGFADSSAVRFPIITVNPLQFCSVWGGDITGNGALDLYFSNYAFVDGSEDVLLINDGTGHFTDESITRLDSLRNSAFGTSVEIHDMDNDGDQDIVKISTSYAIPPWNEKGVFLLFNDGTGTFSNWMTVTPDSAKAYMFTITDFDRNGTKDVYVVDDQQDYVQMASDIIPDSSITFSKIPITDLRTIGFGGNCKLADLDGDQDQDLGICDVDISIPPCDNSLDYRKFSMMENSGGILTAPYGLGDSIWNLSTYDFEFIDLDNNGTQDIFQGLCVGYAVLMNTGQILPCTMYTSSTVYVDSSASGAGNGQSWSDAFTSLGQALYALNNCSHLDTIFISEGTYYPSVDGNRSVSFTIPDGATLLGGFARGGGPVASRDPDLYKTVLSGEIGNKDITADNSYHVVVVEEGKNAGLDGFIIRYGNANGSGILAAGAGLFVGGNLSLKNAEVALNECSHNGSVIYSYGTLSLENCRVQSNQGLPHSSIWIAPGSIANFMGLVMID